MKKQGLLLLIFCLLLLGMQQVQAQRVLLIKKLAGSRRYEFTTGDTLRLKLKDSAEVLQGSWQYAGADAIRLAGRRVYLRDIRWIDVSGKEKGVWILRKGQDLLILAGLGYFTVAHVNIPVETGRFALDQEVARTSGLMVAGGVVCRGLDRLLHRRKVPVSGRRFGVTLID